MPRSRRPRAEADTEPALGEKVPGRILVIAEHNDHFHVELLLTDPREDYRIISVMLPAPIRPSNRIGQLLSAANISVTPGERIDIDQAVGQDICVCLMQTESGIEPIAFVSQIVPSVVLSPGDV